MDQGELNQSVREGGTAAFMFQSGSHTVNDSQGIVNGPNKSNNHVDNSKNQVISFETFVNRFSFKLTK